MASDADVCCPACKLVFPVGKGLPIPPFCDGLPKNEATFTDPQNLESDDIAYLDSHIAHLEQRVLALKERRDEVNRRIHAPKQTLPPIQRLPDDTLLDIFLYCIPLYSGTWSDLFTGSMNSLDICNAPWSLSQVCQRWRRVSLSSRLLWCFVGLDLGGMLWIGPAEQYRLTLHLERSKDLELYVNLSVHAVSEYTWGRDDAAALRQEEGVRQQLLGVLKATTRRWKGLRTHLPDSILHGFSDCTFDSLQELFVQYPWVANNAPLSLFKGFATAPRLRTFALLTNLTHCANPLIPRIPWSQITDFGNIPSPAWIAVERLREMKNLQRLNLGAIRVNVPDTSNLIGRPISLPSLTFLFIPHTIRLRDGTSFSHAFRSPALKHVRIGGEVDFRCMCDSRMFRAVTRLEIVKMDLGTFQSYHLCQFLLVTPNVEHFQVSSHLCDEFFQTLTLSDRGGHTNVLPRLRILDITEAEYAIALDDCILDMLESRCAVLQELHTCTGFSFVGGRPDSPRWQRVCQAVRIVHTRETLHLDEPGVEYDDDDDDDSDYVPGTDSASEYTSGMTDEE